jgi:DNA-binding transcriptional LysR family regulator
MDLPLASLRSLEAVARHGSFSRAAAEMRLTQPAVSMQVRQVEERLGVSLIERVGKRAFPTEAGAILLAHAERAFHELQTGVERVQELRGIVAGRVRLGTSASISVYLLPPLLRRFRARFPDTELVIVTGNAPEIAKALVDNELDLGVVSLPVRHRELVVSPFFKDDLVAVAPARPEWRRHGPIGPTELARHPLILFEQGATIRRVIDEWFSRGGAPPARRMEMGNTEAIKKLVGAGLGLSVTSWFSVEREARTRQLHAIPLAPPLARAIGVARRRDKPMTPSLQAFLAALDELRASLERRRRRR